MSGPVSGGVLKNTVTWMSAEMTPSAREIFTQSNVLRSKGVTCQGVAYPAAPPLTEDKTVTAAAQLRAADLAASGEFTHTPSNGKNYVYWLDYVRLSDEFPVVHFGENLGQSMALNSVMDAWEESTQGHCETQFTGIDLDSSTGKKMPGFTRAGVGDAVDPNTQMHYWVVLFAN